MIHTLTTSLALYKVNRNKVAMLTAMERRRAFWLILWIIVALAIAAYFFTR